MKKGFLLSLFVITALALIVLTFRSNISFQEQSRSDIFKDRVEQTNLFIEDLERDIERTLYVASFRAFLGADEFIVSNESYIKDVNKAIPELIINGTIEGKPLNATNASTFGEWTERIKLIALRYHINLSFDNISVKIEQISPWIIAVDLETNVSIRDFSGVMGWNFTIKESTTLDISKASFSDPLYYIESLKNKGSQNRPLVNTIKKSPYSQLWHNITGIVNISWLRNHTANQLYWHPNNYGAPSFLMRLEGKDCQDGVYTTNCSKFGIESFVAIENKSYDFWEYSYAQAPTCAVDHQFFKTDCMEIHQIYGMDDKFRLDNKGLVEYDLTKINIT